ncbi:membrane protein [Clostridium acetobutylicum]|nr:membrane protein [Clostridium acetobutylicum]
MKNIKILLFNILNLIIISIMLLTVSLKNRISSKTFDNLMFLYGLLFSLLLVTDIIIIINKNNRAK